MYNVKKYLLFMRYNIFYWINKKYYWEESLGLAIKNIRHKNEVKEYICKLSSKSYKYDDHEKTKKNIII